MKKKRILDEYKCADCKQTELFIATFTLAGECVVNPKHGKGSGSVIAGIDSSCPSSISEHCDGNFDTMVDEPSKCAVCGSENILIKQGTKYVEL